MSPGNRVCLRHIIEAGGDLSARSNDGKTPLAMAHELKSIGAYRRALADGGRNEDGRVRDKPLSDVSWLFIPSHPSHPTHSVTQTLSSSLYQFSSWVSSSGPSPLYPLTWRFQLLSVSRMRNFTLSQKSYLTTGVKTTSLSRLLSLLL